MVSKLLLTLQVPLAQGVKPDVYLRNLVLKIFEPPPLQLDQHGDLLGEARDLSLGVALDLRRDFCDHILALKLQVEHSLVKLGIKLLSESSHSLLYQFLHSSYWCLQTDQFLLLRGLLGFELFDEVHHLSLVLLLLLNFTLNLFHPSRRHFANSSKALIVIRIS